MSDDETVSPEANDPGRRTDSATGREKLPLTLIGGCALIALALIVGYAGAERSTVAKIIMGGLLLILWPRRIFRAGVTRTGPDEVVVRSAPWYEGFTYGAILISPVIGALMVIEQLRSPAPADIGKWFWAFFFLGVSIVIPWGCIKLRRRCFLHITPTTLRSGILTARSFRATPDPKAIQPDLQLTRDQVKGISIWNVPPSPVDRRWLGIIYRPEPESAPIIRFVGGPQLTVHPDNLMHALVNWYNADPEEPPTDLIDRIQTILQDRPETGPDHQHWGGGPGSGGKGPIGAVMFLADTCSGIYYKVKLPPKIPPINHGAKPTHESEAPNH